MFILGNSVLKSESSTNGGGTATPVTVTTLDDIKSALASSATSKVILISGTITGNEVLKVPSNTTVIGKSGASKLCYTYNERWP